MTNEGWGGRPDEIRVRVDMSSLTVWRIQRMAAERNESPGRLIELGIGLLWVSLMQMDREEVVRRAEESGRELTRKAKRAGGIAGTVDVVMRRMRKAEVLSDVRRGR